MLSYWETQSLLNYDYIIIGSGIVGLSTAISLKEENDKHRVVVMERDILPTGASTKNAGFACIGSLTEILDDIKTMGKETSVELVKTRLQGLKLLRERLGDANIGYKENGSYEVISDREIHALDHLKEVNDLLRPIFNGKDAFTLCPHELLNQTGFNENYVRHLIQNNFEGEINTGKMMSSLISHANRMGVEILSNCKVEKFEDLGGEKGAQVSVFNQTLGHDVTFRCKKLAICTNAFTGSLIPNIDVIPGRGQVVVTEPIPNLKFKGIYHFDEGYYYFRVIDDRILFGGGRNLDFEKEKTSQFQFNQKIQDKLLYYLSNLILGVKQEDIKIAQRWVGIMAFGKDKKPIIEYHSPNIVLGVRMGGMGVAIGSLVGQKVASLCLINNRPSL
ncbi:hypothetical protein DLAC_00735 [Tieghemostelium lacteum]|uniref:FAD dependent oxidoreductase domain-containing protein n=1 Tax=Tieghemostelium lacteum TaxID=361077 RepID=A0A152A6V7_TIELA|nr:hypothetical protein DLAC_00735 [Tieghemostelium lacteum]|eukprot:KYR01944.1 hypothetical protein DLAC_00735 [Tieghemostelium lacteum]